MEHAAATLNGLQAPLFSSLVDEVFHATHLRTHIGRGAVEALLLTLVAFGLRHAGAAIAWWCVLFHAVDPLVEFLRLLFGRQVQDSVDPFHHESAHALTELAALVGGEIVHFFADRFSAGAHLLGIHGVDLLKKLVAHLFGFGELGVVGGE